MATKDGDGIQQAESDGPRHDPNSLPDQNPIFEQFDRATLEAIYNQCTDLNILVAGVTGSGKSSLANAIVGSDGVAFAEGGNVGHCTEHVTPQPSKRMKKLRVWDSPGLMDGTNHDANYLREIECILNNFEAGDVVLFCIEAKPRFTLSSGNPDVQALLKMKKKFGSKLFNYLVIALTYADTIPGRACGRDPIEYYRNRIQEYKDRIRDVLKKYVGINHDTAQNIPVLPVQHQSVGTTLPNGVRWLTELWRGCLDAVHDINGKAKWIEYFKPRIVEEPDENPEVAQHQLILSDNFYPQRLIEWRNRYQQTGGSLGVLGLLGGPLMLLTIPMGIWAGGRYGTKKYCDSLRN